MTSPAREPAGTVAAALAVMDPDKFTTLIKTSLGKETDPAVWDALTDRSVIARTKAALSAIDRDLLSQLQEANTDLDAVKGRCFGLGPAGRGEYAAARAEQADWRRRLAGFRRLVLRRMAFVKERAALIAASNPPAPPGWGKVARQHNRAALEGLARAVAAHRQAVTSGRGDESDDDRLWESLTTITAMTAKRGELPLAEWLGYLGELRDDETGDPDA